VVLYHPVRSLFHGCPRPYYWGMAISDEKYVATTTYRKSGTAVPTATWIVPLDGNRVGFWTSSASGKYKRLRNDPRIVVQPADARGRVKDGSQPAEGTVQLVSSGADFDAIQHKVRAKYGVMVPLSRFFNTLGHLGKKFPYGDVGVVVTLTDPALPRRPSHIQDGWCLVRSTS
jgi:PPOX class probable F420-dependent enzyme